MVLKLLVAFPEMGTLGLNMPHSCEQLCELGAPRRRLEIHIGEFSAYRRFTAMGMDEIMKEMPSARNIHVQQPLHIVEEHKGQHRQLFLGEEDRSERKERSTKERLIM